MWRAEVDGHPARIARAVVLHQEEVCEIVRQFEAGQDRIAGLDEGELKIHFAHDGGVLGGTVGGGVDVDLVETDEGGGAGRGRSIGWGLFWPIRFSIVRVRCSIRLRCF